MSVAVRSVAAWRSATTYPPRRSRATGGGERRSPRPVASGWRSPESSSSEPRSQPAAAASAASTSGSSKRQRTRARVCQIGVPRTLASRPRAGVSDDLRQTPAPDEVRKIGGQPTDACIPRRCRSPGPAPLRHPEHLKSSAAIVAMRPSRRLLARGRASGLPLTQMYAWVATMEDRQVVHQPRYLDHAEALGVVGLPDQAM
jgi:hypothetical protein